MRTRGEELGKREQQRSKQGTLVELRKKKLIWDMGL